MSEYLESKRIIDVPRLPLKGQFDLTYRCNNDCRHCWLRIAPGAQERQEELTLEQIIDIVDQARQMGCRRWFISGGEPMLRPDFAEIFDYITRKCVSYNLNTNGTLITPKIAKLMRRKGRKMVALYGATAEVHDHITRNPGSFEATMRGFAYLKEAGADSIVQVIPMRDNYHQFDDMVRLAETLSHNWRIGATWLYLSACGDQERNQDIISQRLAPKDVVKLEMPDMSYEEAMGKEYGHKYHFTPEDDRLFAGCVAERRDFHIDPYGQMTFCVFIKDPSLCYDLTTGSFEECWNEFIPSLADSVKGGREYLENCGACERKDDCTWCPVYGYLEHGRFSAKVEYLCAVAKERRMFKEEWKKHHCRHYQIGGITIRVESDIPITDTTFSPKFKHFQIDEPEGDPVTIRHHFSLPDLDDRDLGEEVYRRAPWRIYKKGNSWVYVVVPDPVVQRVAVFNHDHTRGKIYSPNEDIFRKGNLHSLSLLPTDQIFLAQILALREGCYLHSAGVSLDGKGLLFVGHSDAGKSTMMTLLRNEAEVLCDDRMIVRRWPDGFKIYGTWSHGDVPYTSSASAPLTAIMFLQQARENQLISLDDKKEITKRLLACLVKPLVTGDWWHRTLNLVERMINEVPFYVIQFDKTSGVADLLKGL